MNYKWTVIFVLSIYCGYTKCAKFRRRKSEIAYKQQPTARTWYLGAEGVCSGTDNGRAKLQEHDRQKLLRIQYENCTRVYGNVEITHFREEDLNGTNPDEYFSFLRHIQQITGYLLIYENEFENISFPSLEIIWGDTKLDDVAAIAIANNDKLKFINLPKLRSVEKGKIILYHNAYLCNWNSTVSYDELFGDEQTDRLDFHYNFKECKDESNECAENCGTHCWGPKMDMCQTVYRAICPSSCTSGMCFERNNETKCCDDACAAGCYGEGKSACVACAKLEQDSRCVDKCNGLTDYDRILKMTVNHTQPRYTYDRYCVERCPGETLIQGDHCVVHCTSGYWHDPERNTRICEKCPNGICSKKCFVNETLDSTNIEQLRNCTLIEGFIKILQHPFEEHSKFFENGTVKQIPALTIDMLDALNNVKVVTEFVEIQAGMFSPLSLNFLRNLAVIEGRKLQDYYALLISSNSNLRELGLRSLKKISNGRIYIGANHALCYVNTMEKHLKKIVQTNTTNSSPPYKIIDNRLPHLCEKFKRYCDETCDKDEGCWGAGPEMCVKCAKYDTGQKCVNICPQERHYLENGTICKRCHPECISCNSDTAQNCTDCVHVELQQGAGRECLSKCPETHYQSGKQCLPCSTACYHFGCTGPFSYVGKGGCNKCMYGESCSRCQHLMCLIAKGKPIDVCIENNLTNFYTTSGNPYVEQFVCEECSPECTSCVGYGTLVNKHRCMCAHYLTTTHDGVQKCTMECESNSYMLRNETTSRIGECKECDPLCDRSCIGDSPMNCTHCAKATVFEDGLQICLEECPLDKPFLAEDRVCYTSDPIKYAAKRKAYVISFLVLCALFLMIALTFITWNLLKYKKRYKKEKEMNLPTLPESEPMDPTIKPNMSRLCIITIESLSKTSRPPLGKGEFGTVHAGYWYPKGRDGGEKVPVAIKELRDEHVSAQQEMLEEAGIMASMRHEHLLRLVGVCLSNGMQLVTPLRPLGSLRDFLIKHRQKLGARDLLLYCYQIASAMEYLFKHHLVHRDLAARNVLVKRANHVEVTDFGLAKMLDRGKNKIIVGGKVAVKWLALESLQRQVYTHWTDVWAFGVTCWEVLTFGQTPYQGIGPEQIRKHLELGNRLEQPNNCAEEPYQTLLQCWLENPESRPSFVILKEKFNQYCRVPNLYVVDRYHKQRMDSISPSDQRELINELLEDSDFTDPLEYFDHHDTLFSLTSPPTSPCDSAAPLPPLWNAPQHIKRLKSADSGRYQKDPVREERTQIGMDEGNYLVPSNQQSTTMLYTPIVVRENGETELMRSAEYCNDKIGSYYNGLKPVAEEPEEEKPYITPLENMLYVAESETSL